MSISVVVLLLTVTCLIAEVTASSPPTSAPVRSSAHFSSSSGAFHPEAVRNFVRARCNGEDRKSGVWVYEGTVFDPSNNRKIADVEGLELVRQLTECYNYKRNNNTPNKRQLWSSFRGFKRLGDLSVRHMLQQSSGRQQQPQQQQLEWDYATTILSRKLFCYRAPNNNRQLLNFIRLRPTSPRREISTDEAVALYDTAVTFISRNGGREMVIHTEWPDGRWVTSSAESILGATGLNGDATAAVYEKATVRGNVGSENAMSSKSLLGGSSMSSFDYTIYARLGGMNRTKRGERNQKENIKLSREMPELPPLLTHSQILQSQKRSKNKNRTAKNNGAGGSSGDDDNAVVISPPRSQFIQFGQDRDSEQRRYGARESYSYAFGQPIQSQNWQKRNQRRRRQQNIVSSLKDWTKTARGFMLLVKNDQLLLGDDDDYLNDGFDRSNFIDLESSSSSSSEESDIPCTLQYTRYGECPPWYGPGRMCTLELRGRRVPSVLYAPPLAASLIAGRIPGFMSVDTPIPTGSPIDLTTSKDLEKNKLWKWSKRLNWRQKNEKNVLSFLDPEQLSLDIKADNCAVSAVEWFRSSIEDDASSLPLKIQPEEESAFVVQQKKTVTKKKHDGTSDEDDDDGILIVSPRQQSHTQRIGNFFGHLADKGFNVVQRIQAATTSAPLPSNSLP